MEENQNQTQEENQENIQTNQEEKKVKNSCFGDH